MFQLSNTTEVMIMQGNYTPSLAVASGDSSIIFFLYFKLKVNIYLPEKLMVSSAILSTWKIVHLFIFLYKFSSKWWFIQKMENQNLN